ncbi:MAG: PcfJ domain-containing protein [Alphaproteobacteria bacterium]|nr:PcfJ domain-containing protein [Alphaproteobacteria bacterium]
MIIANYDEFIQVINSLFHDNEVNNYNSFVQAVAKSKTSRNIKRNRYQNELTKLKTQIQKCKQELRRAGLLEDKKKCSFELKKLNKAKRELIKKNKAHSELSLFSEMGENAKIYACCRHLLSKYLPQALSEDMTSIAELNDDGSVIVNPKAFKDSRLYQDAAHIKDYVTSYFENYPERIKGTRYFIGLHRKATTLPDLLSNINGYFEKLNSPDEKESNRIKKSHIGIEVIKVYPESQLQVVRVTTKAGLNYEGSAMHHCVGSYASKVEKGETQIYSLRDMREVNQELIPHATVEFKNGKIAQIKGPNDSIIAFKYVDYVRDILLTLVKSNDFQDIINDANIPNSDKNNIGLFKDINDKIHDLFDFDEQDAVFDKITITEEALTALPLHKMKIKNLTYKGHISSKGLETLSKTKFNSLNFVSLEYDETIFDYSKYGFSDGRYISLNMKAPQLKRIILPQNVSTLELSGDFDNLETLELPAEIKSIQLKGKFPKLKTISSVGSMSLEGEFPQIETLPSSVENLSLTGNFPKIETIPDSVLFLSIKGKLPNIRRVNPDNLISLKLIDTDILQNINLSEMNNLQHLSLYGNSLSSFKKLPQSPKLEELRLSGKGYWLGDQAFYLGDNFTAAYPKLKNLILNGSFPNVRHLDLSLNTELVNIEALGSKFENLQFIRFPDKLRNCILDHTILPEIEELDFSNTDNQSFGYIKELNLGKLVFDDTKDMSKQSSGGMQVEGLSLSFSHLGKLRSLKFPLSVKEISVQNFIDCSNISDTNLGELKELEDLKIALNDFDVLPALDLSQCSKLKSISISGKTLRKTTLPTSIQELSIVEINNEMSDISIDDSSYKNITTLECIGFLPDERVLKPSVKNLKVQANQLNLTNLTEIDMGKYQYADIHLSDTSLSSLKKVTFPQTFKKMYLENTSDKLSELDFSHTVGEVRIHQRGGFLDGTKKSYYKIIRNGVAKEVTDNGHTFDNFLMLSDEQLQNIKHIKLGKDTRLFILRQMPISPDLTVEFAFDTPQKAINLMRRENPAINFVQEQNSKYSSVHIDEISGKGRN